MTRYVREPGVLWRRSGDQVLLMPAASLDVCVLGETGLALWEALAEPVGLREVSVRLSARYEVPAERVAADLEPVLEDLDRRQLVRRCA